MPAPGLRCSVRSPRHLGIDHRREEDEGSTGTRVATSGPVNAPSDDHLAGAGERLGHVGMIAGSRLLIVERERWRVGLVSERRQRLDGGAVHARVDARVREQEEG